MKNQMRLERGGTPLAGFETKGGKRPKTALVLAGGGVTGVVYEVGVLQALSNFLTGDFTIHDFDMVIGISAGSIVGSFLVNGVPPSEMIGALGAEPSDSLRPFSKWDVYRPNFGEFFQRALKLPFNLLNNLHKNLSHSTFGKYPYAQLFDEILPSAMFSNHKVEEYVRTNLRQLGGTNDFRKLKKDFYVIATELDTGDRVVFGHKDHQHVPISKAVQASTAIPLFYKPVRIGRREYVDGALRKTLSIDLAIERGAELIVCINPVVPLRNDIEHKYIPMLGHKERYISSKGFHYVWRQMLRLMLHSRIPAGLERYRHFYPNVDIILIEPREDDYKMFFHNIMDYDARVSVAEHGYKTVMSQIRENYAEYSAAFARHEVEMFQARERSSSNSTRVFNKTSQAVRKVRLQQMNNSEMGLLHTLLEKLDKALTTAEETTVQRHRRKEREEGSESFPKHVQSAI